MARAVIRYAGASSVESKRLRERLRATLADAGFVKTGNAAWSVDGVTLESMGGALEEVGELLRATPPSSFEQLWIMVDRADEMAKNY